MLQQLQHVKLTVVTVVCIDLAKLELKNCVHKFNVVQLPVFARSMQTTLRD